MRRIISRVAFTLMFIFIFTLTLVHSAMAAVSMSIDPEKAVVGTSAKIWIKTGNGEITIPKGDLTVTDPNGRVSVYDKLIYVKDTGVIITYPDDQNWSPAGSVNTPCKYTVEVKTYNLKKNFWRTTKEKVIGGVSVTVDGNNPFFSYIGITSLITASIVIMSIFRKRT